MAVNTTPARLSQALASTFGWPPSRRSRGFTLLELMVVIAIMAIAVAGVSFALRDNGQQTLERDAQRLIAQLESGRALSRSSGQALHWRAQPGGYRFDGSATRNTEQPWLNPGVDVQWPTGAAPSLLLGPEPMLPPQAITLRLAQASVRIASDGLRPFAVEAQP